MGSACQKNFIDYSDYVYTDEIKLEDLKIEHEKSPLKIHKGGRKVLHKSKTPFKHFESENNDLESAIQSIDLICPQPKSCQFKSTHYSSENKVIAKETQNHLISIIKQQSSYVNSQLSLLAFSTIYSKRQQTSTKIRGQSEKHVRFKLPKSHKQKYRSHSQFRIRSNTQLLIHI